MPAGLLPSRSVCPEPGMMRITGPRALSGVRSVPYNAPAGPGASIGDSAGAARAAAATPQLAAMTMISFFMR
jgi:hypothetical protein